MAQQIEASFTTGDEPKPTPKVPIGVAAGGLAIAALSILLLAGVIALIILLVKLAL